MASSSAAQKKSPLVATAVPILFASFGVTVGLAVWRKWRSSSNKVTDNEAAQASKSRGVPRAAVKAGGSRKPNKKKNKSYARAEKAARKARQAEKRASEGTSSQRESSEGTTLYNPYTTFELPRNDVGRVAALKKFNSVDKEDDLISSSMRRHGN